jgi:hypothetical protein
MFPQALDQLTQIMPSVHRRLGQREAAEADNYMRNIRSESSSKNPLLDHGARITWR